MTQVELLWTLIVVLLSIIFYLKNKLNNLRGEYQQLQQYPTASLLVDPHSSSLPSEDDIDTVETIDIVQTSLDIVKKYVSNKVRNAVESVPNDLPEWSTEFENAMSVFHRAQGDDSESNLLDALAIALAISSKESSFQGSIAFAHVLTEIVLNRLISDEDDTVLLLENEANIYRGLLKEDHVDYEKYLLECLSVSLENMLALKYIARNNWDGSEELVIELVHNTSKLCQVYKGTDKEETMIIQNAGAIAIYARVQVKLHQYEEAEKLYIQALHKLNMMCPYSIHVIQIINHFCELLYITEKYDTIIVITKNQFEHITKEVAVQEENWGHVWTLLDIQSSVYEFQGLYDEQERILKHALSLKPMDSIYMNLASLYWNNGMDGRARLEAEKMKHCKYRPPSNGPEPLTRSRYLITGNLESKIVEENRITCSVLLEPLNIGNVSKRLEQGYYIGL
eukprot:TRINITY_DN3697_c0_g1_i1.p1 TRINITY_DN3697_c0_g1~~TRINITY_DN3697_c0_g1_i1.p1  ORF type:complete len:475 (-),score=104.08 TRINITY_DN3697_c0_g1_i1:266-1621(-)